MINMFRSWLRRLRLVPEARHSLWMLLGQGGVSMSAFLLTYVLANYVSKEVVGEYRFVLAAYSTIAVFAMYGIGTALMQAVAAGKSGSVIGAFKDKLKHGLVGTLLFIVLASYYYFAEANLSLSAVLFLAAFTLPLAEAYGLYGSYLQGASRFKLSAAFLATDRIVTALAVAGVAIIEPKLLPITGVYLLTHTLVVLVMYRYALKRVPHNSESDGGLLPYAKHITLMSIVGSVTSQLDKYILFIFFGPVPLALYWIASTIPQEVARVVSVITGTFFPRYVAASEDRLLLIAKQLFWISGIVLLCIGGLYVLVAPTFFSLFLPEYTNADGLSAALMFSFGFIPYYFVWQIFSAKKNVKALYYLSIGEPLLIIFLYIILIPLWGLWGLVAAVSIRTIVMNCLALWYLYVRKKP